jgi:ABC-type branched-subunit amino acid transport system substrate-binding protein
MTHSRHRTRYILGAGLALIACGPGEDGNAVTVGVVLDYTGNASATGFNLERGALLAEELVGQVRADEVPFRLRFRDARGTSEGARQASEALISGGAVAIIGAVGDELVGAVAAPVRAADLPFLSPTATTGTDATLQSPWFRMSPGNSSGSSAAGLMGESLAKTVNDRGIARVGIIGANDVYHRTLTDAFVATLQRVGSAAIIEIEVDEKQGVSNVAREVAARRAEVEGFVVAMTSSRFQACFAFQRSA